MAIEGAPTKQEAKEEALQEARASGLTLLKAKNKAGFFGVHRGGSGPGYPKLYQARVRRGSNVVSLGRFLTAEEAALCIARSPEGQAMAKKVAATPLPLTSEEALQQAGREGLTLLQADNTTGYFCVSIDKPGRSKHYQARIRRAGKDMSLGCFATAEEAALCVARSPEGQAAVRAAEEAAPPLTREEALHQVQVEGLMLRVAENKAGYLGVSLNKSCLQKPYQAQVSRNAKLVYLGRFATPEEAALCIARTPEGRAAAEKAGAAAHVLQSLDLASNLALATVPPPLASEEALRRASAEGLTMLMTAAARPRSEAEGEVDAVDEEERTGARPKRQRGSGRLSP